MEEEKQENQLQVMPENEAQVMDLEKGIERAEKYMTLLDKMRKLSIKITNSSDWIDQSGTPYLQDTGCSKISKGFGVSIYDVNITKERETDENGDYIIYTTDGHGAWHNNTEHAIGTCSTRDDFFSKRKRKKPLEGESSTYHLPLSEVDLPNVKKKSHTNFHNRLVKKLLGLSFTWEEIEKYSDGKILKSMCTKFTYDTGKTGGQTPSPEAGKQKSEIREWILEMCGGDVDSAKAMLQHETSFKNKEGETIQGKPTVEKLTVKQLPFTHVKIKKLYNAYLDKRAGGDNATS